MQAPDDTKISQSRPATEPADLDIDQARLSFHRAASDYEEHAWLQQEVGGRLLERLDELNTQPSHKPWLIWVVVPVCTVLP